MENDSKWPGLGYANQLFEQFTDEMEQIQVEESTEVEKKSSCAALCQYYLSRLKEEMLLHPFGSSEEEIQFFKTAKPRFATQLVYYCEVFSLELRRPAGSVLKQEEFLLAESDRITMFFRLHSDFYRYYRSGNSYNDEMYFLRQPKITDKQYASYFLDIDPVFSTGFDQLVARLKAYDRLSDYLQEAIDKLHYRSVMAPSAKVQPLSWTAPKVALAELIYAFHAYGVFADGHLDIHKITEGIGTMFGMRIGNIYKVFEEIRLRKKNRTQFLDKLRERLQQRMEDDDERAF